MYLFLRVVQGVDKLATLRNVESLYLHVDVTNSGAIGLYEKLLTLIPDCTIFFCMKI